MTGKVWTHGGVIDMKWYYIVLLICVIIAPFDALYMYIKAERRKDALKKRKQDTAEKDK